MSNGAPEQQGGWNQAKPPRKGTPTPAFGAAASEGSGACDCARRHGGTRCGQRARLAGLGMAADSRPHRERSAELAPNLHHPKPVFRLTAPNRQLAEIDSLTLTVYKTVVNPSTMRHIPQCNACDKKSPF